MAKDIPNEVQIGKLLPDDDWPDLPSAHDLDLDRHWYGVVSCDAEELNRLLQPRTASDWLLRIRADAILDHPRLFRVSRARAQRTGRPMLADPLARDFSKYLATIDAVDRMICEDVPCGYLLTNIPDAQCLKTEAGKIITVSEVLRHFIYFMSLSVTEFDVAMDTRFQAALIAVRAMLLSETMDFELDPRGIVPRPIHAAITRVVNAQLQFIIGHEYAHHRRGHSFDRVMRLSMHRGAQPKTWSSREVEAYTREWVQEFEADLEAIRGCTDPGAQYHLVHGAIHFFLALLVYEMVAEHTDPEFRQISTHPPTLERYWAIVHGLGEAWGIDRDEAAAWLRTHQNWAETLIEYAEKHPDSLTRYGSIYLERWRDRVRVDRRDF